jgi:hypothetical protein
MESRCGIGFIGEQINDCGAKRNEKQAEFVTKRALEKVRIHAYLWFIFPWKNGHDKWSR